MSNCDIGPSKHGGNGLIATGDVKEGDVLLKVPLNITIGAPFSETNVEMHQSLDDLRTEDTPKDLKNSDSGRSFHHCYLLRSRDPSHSNKTYIGYTTDPIRRLREHNGDLASGGAKKTKRHGRPWEYVAIVGGFESKSSAMQFEWAWQNPRKSQYVREGAQNNTDCKDHKRLVSGKGTSAKLNVLGILMTICEPFRQGCLGVYFFNEEDKKE